VKNKRHPAQNSSEPQTSTKTQLEGQKTPASTGGDHAPSGSPPRSDLHALVLKGLQLASWLHRNISEFAATQQDVQVAQIAIEIARLRGKPSAIEFVKEAAQLLKATREQRARESQFQDRGANLTQAGLEEQVKQHLAKELVSFTQLCRPATEAEAVGSSALPAWCTLTFANERDEQQVFEWRVYRDERDFKKLVRSHGEQIYASAVDQLREIFEKQSAEAPRPEEAAEKPWAGALKAIAVLEDGAYWLPPEQEQKLLAVRSIADGSVFLKGYFTLAAQAYERKMWERLKASKATAHEVFLLNQTRKISYKTRGNRAASRKRK